MRTWRTPAEPTPPLPVRVSKHRLLVTQQWVAGATAKQVAEVMGISEHTVRGIIQRVRDRYIAADIPVRTKLELAIALETHPPVAVVSGRPRGQSSERQAELATAERIDCAHEAHKVSGTQNGIQSRVLACGNPMD